MYDDLKIISRDSNTIDRLYMDAQNVILTRFRDVATLDEGTIDLELPDFDETFETRAANLLDSFVIYHIVSYWFSLKRVAVSEDYSSMSNNYMTAAVNMLRQRKDPRR